MKNSIKFVAVMFAGAALAACGDSSTKPDAAKTIDGKLADAPASGVATEVDCATNTATATVTTTGFAYTPASSTITVNQVVKFQMTAGSNHDVNSNGKGFDTGFGATKCFKFTVAGSYQFKCTPHNFTGTIVVN